MIDEVVLPVCINAQFIRHKKTFMYYRVTDNVLSFILFDKKSFGFEGGIYIQPLYIPSESLVLNLGNEVWCIADRSADNYRLYLDMEPDKITKNIESCAIFLKKTAFDWFDKVGSPKGISDYILSNAKESSWFFTPDKWKNEAKAYSDLYLGKYETSIKSFERFISELAKDNVGSWVDETIKNVKTLVALVKTEPNKINEMLLQTANEMRKTLEITA